MDFISGHEKTVAAGGATLRNVQPRERVEAALSELALETQVVAFDTMTRTALDAAEAIGCAAGAVVKTLLFMADGRPTVVLVPGDRVAVPAALARLLGVPRKRLKMATAEHVMEHTGYAVGAVAPVGMPIAHDVIADVALREHEAVWAAAGTDQAMFRADTNALLQALGAQLADVSEPAPAGTAGT